MISILYCLFGPAGGGAEQKIPWWPGVSSHLFFFPAITRTEKLETFTGTTEDSAYTFPFPSIPGVTWMGNVAEYFLLALDLN